MRITILGDPPAKARPKFTCRGGLPIAYDSQAKLVKSQRAALSINLLNNKEIDLEAHFSHPISLSLSFHCQVPISATIPKRNEMLWGISDDSHPSKKDLDNMIKYLCDIGNGILWKDDRKIKEIYAIQKFSQTPCTIIEISPIKNSMNENALKVTKIFSPSELDLLQTHLCVLRDAIGQIERHPDDRYYIEHASIELITFANEYAQRFNKLAKKGKNG
jgi:Holliday junction resolvase RusA-like endonuclease